MNYFTYLCFAKYKSEIGSDGKMPGFNLSKPQQLIYDMEKFLGGAVSNIAVSVFYKNGFDEELMQRALNAVVETNSSLRIKINSSGGESIQYFGEFSAETFPVYFFPCENEFREWAEDFAKKPMDLHGKLYDFAIILIGGNQCGIMFKLHHLIADAWSIGVLIEKTGECYEKIQKEQSPEPEEHSYADYAAKEGRYINSARYQKDRDFWLGQFEKCREITYLSDRISDDSSSRRINRSLSKELSEKIRNYASGNSLSVFGVLLTALSAYISRVKSRESFYLGTAVVNRSGIAEKKTIGMFINTIAILTDLDGSLSFAESALRISNEYIGAFRHQKYNYSDVLKDIREKYGFKEKLYDVIISY